MQNYFLANKVKSLIYRHQLFSHFTFFKFSTKKSSPYMSRQLRWLVRLSPPLDWATRPVYSLGHISRYFGFGWRRLTGTISSMLPLILFPVHSLSDPDVHIFLRLWRRLCARLFVRTLLPVLVRVPQVLELELVHDNLVLQVKVLALVADRGQLAQAVFELAQQVRDLD